VEAAAAEDEKEKRVRDRQRAGVTPLLKCPHILSLYPSLPPPLAPSYLSHSSSNRKKAANKIFVGGLHWETTDGASPPSLPPSLHRPPFVFSPPLSSIHSFPSPFPRHDLISFPPPPPPPTEKLRKHFNIFGEVIDAVVMKDPISRR